jgi:hypothetical protein
VGGETVRTGRQGGVVEENMRDGVRREDVGKQGSLPVKGEAGGEKARAGCSGRKRRERGRDGGWEY